jgi:hypothetical protein
MCIVAVTLLPGATHDALMAHCRRVMPTYMVPRHSCMARCHALHRQREAARIDVLQKCESTRSCAALIWLNSSSKIVTVVEDRTHRDASKMSV